MLWLLYKVFDELQANILFCLIIAVPLSYLMSIIPNKYMKLALSITVTYTMQTFVFRDEVYFLWAQQIIVYLLMVVSPRSKVGIIIFIESFMYLAIIQIRRMNLSYGINGVDITFVLMMQTFLYIGLGFNYQNSSKPEERLRPGERKRLVKELPDILTYMGFVGYTPACLVGPVYQFNDYSDYLHRRGDFENIPNTIPAAGKQFIVFLCLAGCQLATRKFNLDYLTTAQFQDLPLLQRLGGMAIPMWNAQLKYMATWSISVASVKASGLGYQIITNKDGTTTSDFQRVTMNSVISFFFNPSFKVKVQTWNIGVQKALKNYIYEPVCYSKQLASEKEMKKLQSKAQLLTIMTSAFWHGFYPGYYFALFHWLLAGQISHAIFRLRKKSPKFSQAYDFMYMGKVFQFLFSAYYMAYFGMCFVMMTSEKFMVPIYATYFIPGVTLYIAWVLIVPIGALNPRKRKSKPVPSTKDKADKNE